nr:acyl-CoA reductase [Lautropia sp.]
MTERWTAGYLPGLPPEELQWHTLSFGSGQHRLDIDMPVLQPGEMGALARRVK